MRRLRVCWLLGPVLWFVTVSLAYGSDRLPARGHRNGIPERVPWTTSRVQGSPDPPAPYRTELAFPKLRFNEPLDATTAPGTNRLFVAERYGKILSFVNDTETEASDVFLDLGKVIYGFAFHPQFQHNGYVYVTYVLDPKKEEPKGTRVSRFVASRGDPPRCDPATETILIEWPSGGHNGGCLQFGPDGFLYVGTGDSSGIADEYLTGQDLSCLPGSILRIDVDRQDAGKAYAIPTDNPFVEVAGARPEIWAYGLRQPWKMSFDRTSGDLWVGNVGQDLWEQIYLIERGGNYGWSVMEGSHPFRPQRARGPTPILMPIVEHDHASFRSITGGYVYHGTRLKELVGAYIYGDYDTGKIWMLRYDGQQVIDHRELLDSNLRLVSFAEDHAGELYLVDHMGGGIHRLAPNPAFGTTTPFPRKLSQTGLFASVKDHQPAPGLIPYSVNAPQWCDGATKERFLGLPVESRIERDAMLYPQPAPGAPPGWKFPDGTVLVETISMEMEVGQVASRRRLETRILHHQRLTGSEEVGDQVWQGYSYVWNDDQTDAVLVENPAGLDRTLLIRDPEAPGGSRQQTWHVPSRTECTVCHNMAAKYALGVNTLQLNRGHDYGGLVANQLSVLDQLGIFTEPLADPPERLPKLVDYRDSTQSLGARARSYLHANCSHCHRKWGGGNAEFQLLATLDLHDTGTVNVRPGQGSFYIPDAAVIAPGDPYRSIVFYRMAKLGPGRMPRIGSSVVDEEGVRLIRDWITRLPHETAAAPVGVDGIDINASFHRLKTATSAEEAQETIDMLLASTVTALRLLDEMDRGTLPASLHQTIVARATPRSEPHVRDLFERFLPEANRTKRLGTVVKPDEILALDGNASRGRQVFFEVAGVQCKTCHTVAGQGGDVGPDLSQIGNKYNRSQLLEHILEPSKQVETKYVHYLLETKRGVVHSGLLVEHTDSQIVLKDAQGKRITIPADQVERLTPQQQSIMPDLLLRDMTARDVADLIAFLSSLR